MCKNMAALWAASKNIMSEKKALLIQITHIEMFLF